MNSYYYVENVTLNGRPLHFKFALADSPYLSEDDHFDYDGYAEASISHDSHYFD